jgi:hypothetical protein
VEMVCPITNANMHIYIIIPLILNTNVYISKPYHIIHVHVCPTKPKRRTLTYHAAALQVHLDLALERPPRGAHWELLPGVYPALSVLRVGVQFTCKTIGHNGQTPIPRSDPCSAAAGTPISHGTNPVPLRAMFPFPMGTKVRCHNPQNRPSMSLDAAIPRPTGSRRFS